MDFIQVLMGNSWCRGGHRRGTKTGRLIMCVVGRSNNRSATKLRHKLGERTQNIRLRYLYLRDMGFKTSYALQPCFASKRRLLGRFFKQTLEAGITTTPAGRVVGAFAPHLLLPARVACAWNSVQRFYNWFGVPLQVRFIVVFILFLHHCIGTRIHWGGTWTTRTRKRMRECLPRDKQYDQEGETIHNAAGQTRTSLRW